MSVDHEPPRSIRTEETFELYDVGRDLHAWKKENTCHSCKISFENWEALHNHKCQPYICKACSAAFDQDFRLTMHQRHSHNFCENCESVFKDKNALSNHQASCSKKKRCVRCEKPLPIKSVSDFCRNCRFHLQKDQKYSLRRNSSNKPPSSETAVKENGNGLHSLTDNEEMDEQNHLNSYPSSVFGKRKRGSQDSIAENSGKKKTLESNSIDSLGHSDTSLDNLDGKCSFRNQPYLPKKNISGKLKSSLVTVLKNSSEKKRSDQSSTSNKNPGKLSKANIADSPCNGLKSRKPKVTKKHNSKTSLLELEKSQLELSSTELKSNCKEADINNSSEECNITPCKETATDSSGMKSARKIDQLPVRKSKRNQNNRKTPIETKSTVVKSKDEEAEVSNESSVKSSDSTSESQETLPEPVEKDSQAVESVENASGGNHNAEKPNLKSSNEDLKETAVKKSVRLNSVRKSQFILNKRLDLDESENSSESFRISVRKSKRKIIDQSIDRSDSEKEVATKSNDKTSVVEKEKVNPAPVSLRTARIDKSNNKRDLEKTNDENSTQENSMAADSDATSSSSTSSLKRKRSSLRKNTDDSLSSGSQNKSADAERVSSSIEVSIPVSKNDKTVSKNKLAPSLARTILTREKNKDSSSKYVNKSGLESSTSSKAVKSKIKDVEKGEKETLQSKKQSTSVKRPKTPENSSRSSRRGSFGSLKQSGKRARSISGNKLNSSLRSSPSSIDYTPELEVSERTPNFLPDMFSTPGPSHSTSNKSASKRSKALGSENDTIKLESLLNVLPDNESGLLLRVVSNTSDNYRCLKCNKLCKTIKQASKHYTSCKTNKVKRTTAVLLKDIIWICMQCNYHCYQMKELSFHRQSCSKPSNNVSIDNCIRNYDNTRQIYCPKCSYSCISLIALKQHQCEQRLEKMTNCFTGVEKVSLSNPIQKYECKYCESTFLDRIAYKKHASKHIVSSAEKTQAIKQEPSDPSEYVIKKFLEPFCSAQTAQAHSLFSKFNFMMSGKQNPSTSEAASGTESVANKKPVEIGKVMSFLQKDGHSSSPLNLNSAESQVPTETWRTYLREYNCRCEKHENATEEKPCLACLNSCIRKKTIDQSCQTDSCTQTDPSILHPSGLLFEDSAVSVPTSISEMPILADMSVADNSVSSSAQSFADNASVSSLDRTDMSSIHIASVLSCTSQGLSAANSCADPEPIPNISEYPPYQIMENDKFPPHLSSDSRKSELYINLILILKANFVDSKYTIAKHNNLVKSIYKLKFDRLAEPHQVHPDEYYRLTEYIPKAGDKSSQHLSEYMNLLQNYFLIDRPFSELMPLFVSQEPCDFDVVLCDNKRHFIHLSWQLAPDICYSAYCIKSDSGIKFTCGLCFEKISIPLLIEHFDKDHEGAYHYNILIS